MNKYRNYLTVGMCSLLIILAAGCATIEGAGKDIESAGQTIQEAADQE